LRGYLSNNLHFGVEQRFQAGGKAGGLPGPGVYNEPNRWNKRTYNLKFLNFQAHAFNNTISATAGAGAGPIPAGVDDLRPFHQ